MSATRELKILYFARLRERIGRGADELRVPAEVRDIGALRAWLVARGEPWAGAFGDVPRVRAAVDQVMARDDTPLPERGEVAFFPPVTGG